MTPLYQVSDRFHCNCRIKRICAIAIFALQKESRYRKHKGFTFDVNIIHLRKAREDIFVSSLEV